LLVRSQLPAAKQRKHAPTRRVKRHFAKTSCTYSDCTTGSNMQAASSSDGSLQLEPPKRRRTTYMPRVPLVLAQEIGSFLPRNELRVCLTQVCSSGLSFVSAPATGQLTANLRLSTLVSSCFKAICAPATSGGLCAEPRSTVYPKLTDMVVERIASLLTRRPHIQRLVLKANCWAEEAQVYHQLNQVGCEEAMVQGRNVAIEWQVCAKTNKSLAPFRALHRLDFVRVNVKQFPVLASCRTLHTVDVSESKIVNLAALASCKALHTLNIRGSKVVDVSVLASCLELRKVNLGDTKISDVSALAPCRELRTVYLMATNVCDVSVLASCAELREVVLDSTRVTDVSALGSCRYLEELSVRRTRVSDVSVFASSQTLTNLYINQTSVTDVSAFVDCVSLHRLSCSGVPLPSGYAEVLRSIDARWEAARNRRH
jgi:hypothetical protein